MALPSRKQQIEAVAKFLDSERNEGRSLEEIAIEIVDGYLDGLLAGIKIPAPPLRQGQLIKHPADNKVRRVAWLEGDKVWLVTDVGSYGWLGNPSSDAWAYCEEYRPKKKIDGKMVEMTDEMIEEAWSNPDWMVGDQVSQRQRQYIFEIIATGPQCVLMRNVKTGDLNSDSNKNMIHYYRREIRGAAEW